MWLQAHQNWKSTLIKWPYSHNFAPFENLTVMKIKIMVFYGTWHYIENYPLNMDARGSYKTVGRIYKTTQHHIPRYQRMKWHSLGVSRICEKTDFHGKVREGTCYNRFLVTSCKRKICKIKINFLLLPRLQTLTGSRDPKLLCKLTKFMSLQHKMRKNIIGQFLYLNGTLSYLFMHKQQQNYAVIFVTFQNMQNLTTATKIDSLETMGLIKEISGLQTEKCVLNLCILCKWISVNWLFTYHENIVYYETTTLHLSAFLWQYGTLTCLQLPSLKSHLKQICGTDCQ